MTVRRMLLFALCATALASAPLEAADDEAGVRAVLRGFEEAWNRHDMDAFGRLFSDDADFVNVRGTRWIGRPAIQEAHEQSHAAQFKNSRLRVGDTTVRFPAPGVAVTRSLWDLDGHTSPTGEPQPPRKGIVTNVLAHGPTGWKIVTSQNTDIVAPAPPTAPAAAASPVPGVSLPAPLARVLTDYEMAWGRKSAAELAGLFAEDGFVLASGAPPVRGRVAIEKHYAGQGGPLALRALAYATEGPVGYIIGAYSRTEGQPDDGKFTLTLRKAADGRWLIVSDMDNGNFRAR